MSKTELVVIAGPTACGKTAVSVKLAQLANGEIISADSMQVYRGMDIGTAKVTPEETMGVKHYLIDEFQPDEEFNVAIFQQRAKQYMSAIHQKGKLPILAGGTGFYINALVYDNDFSQPQENNVDKGLREKLWKIAGSDGGCEILYAKLKQIDPEYAKTVHMNNTKKVIRAIEFYHQSNGKKISVHNSEEKQRKPAFDTKIFVLNMDREKLYKRIDSRVDSMLEAGLLQEVSSLLEKYDANLVSMQGLGYKEFVPYFNGECNLEEAVEILKRDTRHFAKRQLTWFRHQCPQAIWVDMDKFTTADSAAEWILKNLD